jgi:excisionase family DNA binding protein
MSIQKRFKKPPTTIAAVTPFTGPRLLRVKPAAAYLSLGVGTLRKMVKDRTIPHIPEGNKILIDRLDLDRFIESRKVGVAA